MHPKDFRSQSAVHTAHPVMAPSAAQVPGCQAFSRPTIPPSVSLSVPCRSFLAIQSHFLRSLFFHLPTFFPVFDNLPTTTLVLTSRRLLSGGWISRASKSKHRRSIAIIVIHPQTRHSDTPSVRSLGLCHRNRIRVFGNETPATDPRLVFVDSRPIHPLPVDDRNLTNAHHHRLVIHQLSFSGRL